MSHQQSPYSLHGAPCGTQCSEGLMSGTAALVYLNPPQQHSVLPNGVVGQGDVNYAADNGQHQQNRTIYHFGQVKPDRILNTNKELGHPQKLDANDSNACEFPSRDRGVTNTGVVGNENSGGNTQDSRQYVGNNSNLQTMSGNQNAVGGVKAKSSTEQFYSENAATIANCQVRQESLTNRGGPHVQFEKPGNVNNFQVVNSELDQIENKYSHPDSSVSVQASFAQSRDDTNRNLSFGQGPAADYIEAVDKKPGGAHASNAECMERSDTYIDKDDFNHSDQLPQLTHRDYRLYKARAESPSRRREFNEHSNDARENAQRFNGHDAHFWSPLDFHVKDIRTSNSDSFSYIPRLHRGLRPTGGTARTLFSSGSKSSNEDDEDVLISNPRSHLRTNTTRSIMSRISPKTPQPPPSTSGYNPVHGSGASTDFSPLSPGCNSISLTQRRPSSGLSLEELDERCHLLGYSHTALFCAVMNRNEELAAINGSIMGELRQGSQLLRDGFKEYREMGTEIKESLEKNRLAMEDMQEELKSLQQVVRGSTKTGEFGVNPDSYQTSSGRGSFIAGDETRKRNGNGSNTNHQTTNIFPPAHQAQTLPNVLVSTAPLSQELSEGVQQTTANLSPPGRMKTTAGHSNSVAQNLQQPFDSVLPYQTINLQTLPHNALQMPVLGQFPNSPGLQLQTQTQMQPQSLYQPSVLPPMLSNNHLQISANGLNSTMFPETNSQTNCLAQYQNWIAGDQLSSRHSNQDENRPNLQSQRQPENNQTSGYNIEDMNTQRNLESIHSIVTHAALLRDAIHDPNRLTTEVSSQTVKPQTDETSMQTVRLKKEDTSMQTVRLKKEDTSVQTLESSTHSKKTQTAKKTKNVPMQTTNKSGHHVATQVSIQAENIAREGDNSKPPNPIDTNSQSVPPSISLIELDDTPCLEPTKHYTESLLADMLSLQTSFGNVDVPDYSSPFKQSPKVVNTSETEVLQATSSTAVNHTGPNRTFHQRHGESYQINEQPSNIMWPNKIPEERQRLETHCSDKNFEACVDASGDKRFSAKGLGVLVHETSISKLCPMNNNRSAETSGAARALQAPRRDDTNDAMAKKSEHRPPAIKENTNNNARDLGHSHREKVIENKAATNADREAREQTRTSSENRAFFKEQSDEKAQASSDNTLPSDSKCTENTPEQSSPVTPAKHAPSDKEIEPTAGVQLSELEQSETPTSHFQYVTESEEPGRHDVTRAPKSDTQSDQKAQKGRSTKQLVEDRLGDEAAAAAVKNKPEAKATVKNRSDAFFKPESKNAPTPDLDRACWANLPSNCTTLEENKPCTDSQTLTDVGTANKISKTATLGTKCKAQTAGAGRHRASEEDQTKHVYPNPNPECFTAVPVNNTSKVQTEVQPNRSAETSGAARALQAPRRDDTNDAMAKKSEHRPPAIKENTNNNARDLGHSHREKVIENKAATNADREAREQTRTSSETRAFFKEQSDEKAQASSDNTLPSDSKCTENTPEQSSPVTPAKHAPSDKEIEPSAGVQLSELEQSETPTSHFQYVTESEEPGRHDVTRAPKSDTQSDQKAQKGRSTKQLVEDRLGDEAAAAAVKNKPEAKATVKNRSDAFFKPESKNAPTPDLDRACWANLPSNCTTLEENKPCTDSQTLTDVGTANKISKTATLGTKCKAQTTGAGRHRASEEDQTKHVYPNPNPECFTAVPVNITSIVQTEVQPNRSAETSGAARALQAPRRDDTNDAMAKKSEHRPPAIKENTNNNARDLGHSHREKVIENKAATNADREAREQTRTSSETRAFFKEQSDEKAQASSDNTLPSDSKCTENTPEQSSPVTPAKHAPSDKEIEPSAGVQLSELEQSETPTSHFQYVTESEEPGRHDVTRAPKSDTQSDQKAQKGRSTKQLVEDRLGDEAAAAVKNKSDILVEPESKNVPTPDLDRAWYADLPSNDVYRNQHGQSYHAERNTDNSVQKVDTKEYKQIPKNVETFTSFKMNSVQKSLLGTCANVTLPRSQSLPCLSPSNQRTPMVQRERHTVRENQDIFHNGEKNKQTENLDREHQQKYIGESKSFSLDEPIGYAEELIENSEIRTYDYKPEEVRRAFEEAADKSSVKIEDENSHLDSSHKSSLPQINLQDVKTLLEVLSAFALASFVSMQNTYHGSLINPIYDKNNQNESGQSQRMSNQEITNHLEPEMKAKVQTSATQTVTEKESLQDDYNADDQSQFYESLNESSAAFGDNDNNKFDDSLRDQNKSNKSEQVESTSCLQKACSKTIISENFTISVTPKRLPPIKLTTRGEMIPAGHSQPIQTIVAEDADSQAEEEIPQISGSIGSPNADRDLSTLIHASDAGADNKSDVLRRDHREAPVSCKATYESATSDHLTTNVGKPEIDTHSELSKFSTISPENANHARSDPKKIVGKMQVAVKSQHNEETQEESKHVDASTEDNERGIVSNNAATKLTTTMQEPLSSHQARLDHTMDSNVLGAINSSTNTCQSTMCDHTLSGTAIERADEQLNDQTSADHDKVVNHHVVPDAHIRYDHTTKSNINDDIGHGKPTTDKHETITSYPAHASNTTNAVADTQVVEATREDCGSSESFNAQTEDVTCNIQLDKPALRGGAHAVPEEITSKGQPILKAITSNTKIAVDDTQVVEATREDCGSSESFNAQTEDITCNIQLDKPAPKGGAHAVPQENTSKGQPSLEATASNTTFAVADTQVVKSTREDCGSSESLDAQTEHVKCDIQLDKPAPKGGTHTIPEENTSKGQPILGATASNTSGKKQKKSQQNK